MILETRNDVDFQHARRQLGRRINTSLLLKIFMLIYVGLNIDSNVELIIRLTLL